MVHGIERAILPIEESQEASIMTHIYSNRMYRKQRIVELWLKDTHRAAIQYQSSFQNYLDSMKRIFESREYKALPHWRKSYIRGVYDTLFEQLQNSLLWVLTGPDGVKYGPGNDAWLNQSTEYKETMQGNHVWPKAWEQGEYRPFN
jgi:hypothetical protein